MITANVRLAVSIALREAMALKHEYVLCEHLLYSICHSEHGMSILRACGVHVETVKKQLETYLSQNVYVLEVIEKDFTPQSSVMLERVIDRAIEQCLASEQKECGIENILASLMEERDSWAVYILLKSNLSKYDLLKKISSFQEAESSKLGPGGFPQKQASSKKQLKKYSVNLTELAMQGEIDPLIGRKSELQEMLGILGRRKKSNVIIVGDPGVGKTALVEGLALSIAQKKIHPLFMNFEIYRIDVATLLAGTRFRGDFEERVKGVFKELSEKQRAIVFIDEIHTIIGAGATGSGQLDVSNLLKPLLASGKLRFIGATTYQEYRKHFQKDPALYRRFEKLDIGEPSPKQCLEILERLKPSYERFHKMRFSQNALKSAVELSKEFLKERHLPDSAIDVLDRSAAMLKLKTNSGIYPNLGKMHIEETVARMARVPIKKLDRKDKALLQNLQQNLEKNLFGQEQAIEAVVKALKLSRAYPSDRLQPIASFLFAGPTGVGKTELCRLITQYSSLELIRLDMSEYRESHSLSKIIGAPPGYVGYGDYTNQLTEQLRRHPHALVLLDEIEKAHRDVMHAFLQVMDYGKLTDSSGQAVSFKDAIIVMTSNAGAEELEAANIGFLNEDTSFKLKQKIEKAFSPEFRNRLSAIVRFSPVSKEMALRIIKKFLQELNHKLVEKKITLSLDNAAIEYLALRGIDKKLGARPLKRIIDKEIAEPLADEILFGALSAGGHVFYSIKDGSLLKKVHALSSR